MQRHPWPTVALALIVLALGTILPLGAAAAFGIATPVAQATQGAADADAVKALETERFQAMEKNDFTALDRLLAADLVYTHSSGSVDTKAAFIDALKTGKTRYVMITPQQLNARALGDTVLIHGRAAVTVEATVDGKKVENPMTLAFLDVWQQRAGKWQMVAWQSARLPTP